MLGTRVTFVSRRKSPKACQGRCPWTPLGGRLKSVSLFAPAPPAASRTPSKGEGATKGRGICHFDTVKQLAFFSPEAPMEETPTAFKPWRGRGGLMVTEGWERRKFGFCKINSALFWQQIIHKWAARQQPVPSLLPCLLLSLLPSLFPFLRNRKNQTNGFVVRFFEEETNPDGNKYLLFIKDIYRNGYIGERDVCSLVPIPCSHPPHRGTAPAP